MQTTGKHVNVFGVPSSLHTHTQSHAYTHMHTQKIFDTLYNLSCMTEALDTPSKDIACNIVCHKIMICVQDSLIKL